MRTDPAGFNDVKHQIARLTEAGRRALAENLRLADVVNQLTVAMSDQRHTPGPSDTT